MKLFSAIVFLIFFHGNLIAQKNCPCWSDEQRAFDFWIGHWVVMDTTENVVGENTISAIEDGCSIEEKWRGKSGSTGTSLNYYDKKDSTWNQLWVDNLGGILRLKGTWENGAMTLFSKTQYHKEHGIFLNRVTWTPKPDGTVTQKWDLITEEGKILTTVFHGIYRKDE